MATEKRCLFLIKSDKSQTFIYSFGRGWRKRGTLVNENSELTSFNTRVAALLKCCFVSQPEYEFHLRPARQQGDGGIGTAVCMDVQDPCLFHFLYSPLFFHSISSFFFL